MTKLKGTAVKSMNPKEKKEKQKIVNRMIKTRKEDNCWLRNIIKDKLKWAIAEKQKGVTQLEILKRQINRLEGIIIVLTELSEIKKEVKKKDEEKT